MASSGDPNAPWSMDQIRDHAHRWTLEGDAKLLFHLQAFSKNLCEKTKTTMSKIDDMIANLDNTHIALGNATNRFMALQHSQFVESRVYEEDIEQIVQAKKEAPETTPPRDPYVIAKDAVMFGLALLDSHFEAVPVNGIDGTSVLRPKNKYRDRPLPHLIGSEEFLKSVNASSDSESEAVPHSSRSDSPSVGSLHSLSNSPPLTNSILESASLKSDSVQHTLDHSRGGEGDFSRDIANQFRISANVDIFRVSGDEPDIFAPKLQQKIAVGLDHQSTAQTAKSLPPLPNSQLIDETEDDLFSTNVQKIKPKDNYSMLFNDGPPLDDDLFVEKKATNQQTKKKSGLFEDYEDDFDDFNDFQSKTSVPKGLFADNIVNKPKVINLFDDEPPDFDSDFKSSVKINQSNIKTKDVKKKVVSLFDDEPPDDFEETSPQINYQTAKHPPTNITAAKNEHIAQINSEFKNKILRTGNAKGNSVSQDDEVKPKDRRSESQIPRKHSVSLFDDEPPDDFEASSQTKINQRKTQSNYKNEQIAQITKELKTQKPVSLFDNLEGLSGKIKLGDPQTKTSANENDDKNENSKEVFRKNTVSLFDDEPPSDFGVIGTKAAIQNKIVGSKSKSNVNVKKISLFDDFEDDYDLFNDTNVKQNKQSSLFDDQPDFDFVSNSKPVVKTIVEKTTIKKPTDLLVVNKSKDIEKDIFQPNRAAGKVKSIDLFADTDGSDMFGFKSGIKPNPTTGRISDEAIIKPISVDTIDKSIKNVVSDNEVIVSRSQISPTFSLFEDEEDLFSTIAEVKSAKDSPLKTDILYNKNKSGPLYKPEAKKITNLYTNNDDNPDLFLSKNVVVANLDSSHIVSRKTSNMGDKSLAVNQKLADSYSIFADSKPVQIDTKSANLKQVNLFDNNRTPEIDVFAKLPIKSSSKEEVQNCPSDDKYDTTSDVNVKRIKATKVRLFESEPPEIDIFDKLSTNSTSKQDLYKDKYASSDVKVSRVEATVVSLFENEPPDIDIFDNLSTKSASKQDPFEEKYDSSSDVKVSRAEANVVSLFENEPPDIDIFDNLSTKSASKQDQFEEKYDSSSDVKVSRTEGNVVSLFENEPPDIDIFDKLSTKSASKQDQFEEKYDSNSDVKVSRTEGNVVSLFENEPPDIDIFDNLSTKSASKQDPFEEKYDSSSDVKVRRTEGNVVSLFENEPPLDLDFNYKVQKSKNIFQDSEEEIFAKKSDLTFTSISPSTPSDDSLFKSENKYDIKTSIVSPSKTNELKKQLNIDVSTLLPGAKFPKKNYELLDSQDIFESGDIQSDTTGSCLGKSGEESAPKVLQDVVADEVSNRPVQVGDLLTTEEGSSLQNTNSATDTLPTSVLRERAKIQSKRRPWSRKARQESIRKSIEILDSEQVENQPRKPFLSIDTSPTENILTSSAEDDRLEDGTKTKRKVSTKTGVRERKNINVADDLFTELSYDMKRKQVMKDDIIVYDITKTKTFMDNKEVSSSLENYYDPLRILDAKKEKDILSDDEDVLFKAVTADSVNRLLDVANKSGGKKSAKKTEGREVTKPSKYWADHTKLFSDDDGDLFSGKTAKQQNKQQKKKQDLFSDSDGVDDILFSGKSVKDKDALKSEQDILDATTEKMSKSTTKSLFDESDDDDGLFTKSKKKNVKGTTST